MPESDLLHGFCDGYAERSEAVQNGNSDYEPGNLTDAVPRHPALTREFGPGV